MSSLSGFVFKQAQEVYQCLPCLALGSAIAATLSYASRFTPITISNPVNAAKFTLAASLTLIQSLDLLRSKENKNEASLAAKITCISLMAYGIHLIANPEQTIVSFAKLSVLAAASLFLTWEANKELKLVNDSYNPNTNFSIDKLGYWAAKNIYQNIHRTVAATASAAGAVWLANRTFSTLKLDPKLTMIAAVALSVFSYASDPLFEALENGCPNTISRVICMHIFAKILKEKIRPDITLYSTEFNVASAAFTLFKKIDQFIPEFSFWDEEKSSYASQKMNAGLRYLSRFFPKQQPKSNGK